jgi:flagellar motility protein MotE (MotC chaperone)
MLILVGILILIAFSVSAYIFGFNKGKSAGRLAGVAEERDRLNKQWQEILEGLSRESMQKEAELRELKQEYTHLAERLKQKEKAKQEVKPPKDTDELTKRFERLGYEVKKK